MNLIILQCSPNEDGLTAACASAAADGARQAGASVEEVKLNDSQVGMCQACGHGWGQCQSGHECQVPDGFQALHQRVLSADGLVLVTPVYWGEMSESAKAFTDRLRRCEATRDARIIDVGGGTSRLVDGLLALGHTHVSVLDIAEAALAKARETWRPSLPRDVGHERCDDLRERSALRPLA